MSSGLLPAARPTRFAWITRGKSQGPDKIFDEDLGHYTEAAVIPSRGAMIPEWLLVVPRTPCLSIAELGISKRICLLAIAAHVSRQVAAQAGASVIFEHGPGRASSTTGCGVDQAHLHVVGGAPDLLSSLVQRVDEVDWLDADYEDPWRSLPPSADYLMIRDSRVAVRAIVKCPTSQRLRKAMSDLLGRKDEWDYRSHPNAANAFRTKQMFRGAFANSAA